MCFVLYILIHFPISFYRQFLLTPFWQFLQIKLQTIQDGKKELNDKTTDADKSKLSTINCFKSVYHFLSSLKLAVVKTQKTFGLTNV